MSSHMSTNTDETKQASLLKCGSTTNKLSNGSSSKIVNDNHSALDSKNGDDFPSKTYNKPEENPLRNGMYSYWEEHSKVTTIEKMMLDDNAALITDQESAEIFSMLPPITNLKVVELGAGIGRFTGQLAETALHVTAVDFMASFIEVNKEKYGHMENIDFMCADVTKMDLPENSVDVVFSNWLLMYLSDEEVAQVLTKILSWLKDDGFLFFRESCFYKSGSISAAENPTKYRNPALYTDLVHACVHRRDQSNLQIYESVFVRPVQTYIKYKKNSNQLCFLLKSKRVEESEVASSKAKTSQEQLTSGLYTLPRVTITDRLITDADLKEIDTTDLVERFHESIKAAESPLVMDAGCGTGTQAFKLAIAMEARILAVDLCSNSITLGMTRLNRLGDHRVTFEICDLEKLSYPSNFCDAIYCRDTLRHFVDKTHVLASFHRVLKPNGVLYLTDYTVASAQSENQIQPEGKIFLQQSSIYKTTLENVGFSNLKISENAHLQKTLLINEIKSLEEQKQQLPQEFAESDFDKELDLRQRILQHLDDNVLSWTEILAFKS